MTRSTVVFAANYIALSGALSLGLSVLCLALTRVAKLAEILLLDIATMFYVTQTDRQAEHHVLAGTRKLGTGEYPAALEKHPAHLRYVRDTKIHLVGWSKGLSGFGTALLAIACLLLAYLALPSGGR